MTNTTIPQLPNPFTPLAFFPPDAAWQITVSYYACVGSLAVYIWDLLHNLRNDYKLVTLYKVTLPTVIYLMSRWSTLAYLLTLAILQTAPIGNCRTFALGIGWLYPVSMGLTSLLFFFRLRAIYNKNKFITGIFFILWLGVVGGTSTVPLTFGRRATEIGPTKFCTMGGKPPPGLSSSGILTLFFDTSVYLAITWKLTRDIYTSQRRSGGAVRALLTGENLPIFTKGLLQDGQIYYLSTTAINLTATVLSFHIHSVPLAYRFLLGQLNEVIMNVMACRVYRSTKFGLFNTVSLVPTSQIMPTTRRESASAVTIEFSRNQDNASADVELGIVSIDGKRERL